MDINNGDMFNGIPVGGNPNMRAGNQSMFGSTAFNGF